MPRDALRAVSATRGGLDGLRYPTLRRRLGMFDIFLWIFWLLERIVEERGFLTVNPSD
jgi:hypothetical protein